MRYWWVNQNQTYHHEVQGGYLWSPKRNANGARNPFYESMREVAPGDLIFSFMDTRILAVGIAQSYCWESPKPLEFGTAGQNWENIPSEDLYFKEAVCWGRISSGPEAYRLHERGLLPGDLSPCYFSDDPYFSLAYFNSPVARTFKNVVNPTITNTVGDLAKIPAPSRARQQATSVERIVRQRTWDPTVSSLAHLASRSAPAASGWALNMPLPMPSTKLRAAMAPQSMGLHFMQGSSLIAGLDDYISSLQAVRPT